MTYHEKANDLKLKMDTAIGEYIEFCTGTDASKVDYSAINEDIDDAIDMLGGTPAKEE